MNHTNDLLDGLKHLVLMPLIERNESKPETEIESIGLDALIVIERRIRNLSQAKTALAHRPPAKETR